jgi:hypothetical protein
MALLPKRPAPPSSRRSSIRPAREEFDPAHIGAQAISAFTRVFDALTRVMRMRDPDTIKKRQVIAGLAVGAEYPADMSGERK